LTKDIVSTVSDSVVGFSTCNSNDHVSVTTGNLLEALLEDFKWSPVRSGWSIVVDTISGVYTTISSTESEEDAR
jgi:hypothetical protein